MGYTHRPSGEGGADAINETTASSILFLVFVIAVSYAYWQWHLQWKREKEIRRSEAGGQVPSTVYLLVTGDRMTRTSPGDSTTDLLHDLAGKTFLSI